MVELLHELIRIQTEIESARRHLNYLVRQSGRDPYDTNLVTPVALDAAGRAVEQAVEATGMWLKAQVIGLYGSDVTTDEYIKSQRPD